MLVLPPRTVDLISARLERAYRLRQATVLPEGSQTDVWAVVAAALVEMHRLDPDIPLDPELYVAAQEPCDTWSDPWRDLAGDVPARRYRRRVRRIVIQLRDELKDELRDIAAQVRRGAPFDSVVTAPSRSLSALGRYVAAHRAGREDLADGLRLAACEQHRACPLYRQACSRLLPPAAYPVQDVLSGLDARAHDALDSPRFSLN